MNFLFLTKTRKNNVFDEMKFDGETNDKKFSNSQIVAQVFVQMGTSGMDGMDYGMEHAS